MLESDRFVFEVFEEAVIECSLYINKDLSSNKSTANIAKTAW